jgi:hypothetical protein
MGQGPRVERRRSLDGGLDSAPQHLAIVQPAALCSFDCAAISTAVLRAEASWTPDFEGEQYTVGRAFYTHLEEDKTRDYFARAAEADAFVELVAPGLNARLMTALADFTKGTVVRRRGFCGAGIHIFPAGEKVARKGGVIHFDTEGLTRHHLARRKRALSLVLMLQPPERGGGLALWDFTYQGNDHIPAAERVGKTRRLLRYRAGDLAVFDSYRLHQIRPFSGATHRVSATLHAAEIDPGVWETWF